MADLTAFENDTRHRLNRLERELRYWRVGGVLVLSLAAIVVTCAMAQPQPRRCASRLCGSSSPTARTGLC